MASGDATDPEVLRQLRKPQTWAFKLRERLIEFSLLCCGLLSIVITLAIAAVVLHGTYEFFMDPEYDTLQNPERDRVNVWYFFTGTEWSAGFRNAKYGILPLVSGTLMVAGIAALISMPIGLATAIYLSEYASPRVRGIAKPTLELLAGIPTVVYGFFALTFITPLLAESMIFGEVMLGTEDEPFALVKGLNMPTNQLAGGIVVGIMIIPIVASLSEDALRAVPRALRDGSYALGANKFETSLRVVVPAALSGITASFILALSRAVGDTMAVSLACGDRAALSFDPLQGVATMTAFIVRIAQGDVQHGSTDFNSLFAVAAVLFFMTLAMNIFAQWVLKRFRQVYE